MTIVATIEPRSQHPPKAPPWPMLMGDPETGMIILAVRRENMHTVGVVLHRGRAQTEVGVHGRWLAEFAPLKNKLVLENVE